MDKVRKYMIPNVVHHRQNPMEHTYSV